MVQRPTTVVCPYCTLRSPGFAAYCGHCGAPTVLNPAGPQYRLVRKVKAGGQGVLFEGVDDNGGLYAVKKLLDNSSTPEERQIALQMFEREGDLLKGLRHKRIPPIYDCFTDVRGTRYMAMEFLIGQDLESVLETLLRQGHMLEVETIYRWIDQICEVLGYVHSHNLIFRDLKPANIMHTANGICLTDFGNVAIAGESQLPYGTGGYAPREQYRSQAELRSDIYALGATVHQLLTGQDPTLNPFQFAPIYAFRDDVPLELVEAVEASLQEDISLRPQTPDEFVAIMYGQLVR